MSSLVKIKSSGPAKDRLPYRCSGSIGAHLWPGSLSGNTTGVNGDCILLDFENFFFGISDSSDRDPAASGKFLTQFNQLLSSIAPDATTMGTFDSKDLRRWARHLTEKTNRLLSEVKGKGSCTFTGLHILDTIHGLAGVLMHTGDSALYEYLPASQKLFRRTESNFWMVGRVDRLYQTTILESVHESVFVMTTDGIANLNAAADGTPKQKVKSILYRNAVEDIPAELIAGEMINTGLYDDAAVVAFTPQHLKACKRKMLMQ